jgi:hypothetical protein
MGGGPEIEQLPIMCEALSSVSSIKELMLKNFPKLMEDTNPHILTEPKIGGI